MLFHARAQALDRRRDVDAAEAFAFGSGAAKTQDGVHALERLRDAARK